MYKSQIAIAVGALALGILVGVVLPRPWQEPFRASSDGATVVKFEGGSLGANDVARRAASQPPAVRAMLATPKQRKAFVENLVKFELLAQEAVAKGYVRDAAFVQDSKQRLGQLLLEQDVEKPLQAKAPTEEDLRRFFEQNKATLSRPERVRLAAISFAAAEGDALARTTKRAAAESVLSEVKKRANEYYAFGEIAHARSEDAATRASSGELPFMTWGELATRYGEPLANAAFALSEPGKVHDGVVETAVGFHVVKLIGREAGYEPRFDEVKEQIRQRLVADARASALKTYIDELWQRADVRIDEQALQSVKLD